jgi:hypothetical protein
MSIRAALCAALLAQAIPSGQAVSAQQDSAISPFNDLQQLVGAWRVVGEPNSPLRIRFSLTAGGTVLVENWSRKDRSHSLTVYHRDGAAILATHYCPQGNQPRLMSLPKAADGVLRFAFRDATDLDAMREAYLIALSFDLSKKDVLIRREIYRRGGVDETSELKLKRQP